MFDIFSKKRREKALRDEDDRDLYILRYKSFCEILKNNNEVLITMADMQEKTSGAFVFDRAYIKSSYQNVAEGVKKIIDNLNVLGDEKYKDLIIPYQKIDEAIRKRIEAKVATPKTNDVLPLDEVEKENTAAVNGKILLDKGTIARSGVGAGPVYFINRKEDLTDFPEGGVMVVRRAHPEFAIVLQKASALVSDVGSVLGHLAKAAGEFNVPAIFNTEKAADVLRNGMQVTVDAVYGNVYEGVVEELFTGKKPDDVMKASPALKRLKDILMMITPLNLTDPRSPNFGPKGCKTLHDITRFAHEISLKAMSDFGNESYFSDRSARQLVCEVPMQWWVIDLEDGIKESVKGKKVRPEDILSVPMKALWEGMTALPWKGPPPVDTKGFLSVVFKATTDPSIDPSVGKRFADKNYIIISKHFCNLSSRLGFHFSTAEAYVGDNPNENYISFIFKGGAADANRRIRRIQFVGKLLDRFDFRTEIKDDSIFARLEGYDRDYMLDHLKVLGHIIIHTRQLDMVMYNETMVNWYYKDMLKGIESFVRIGY